MNVGIYSSYNLKPQLKTNQSNINTKNNVSFGMHAKMDPSVIVDFFKRGGCSLGDSPEKLYQMGGNETEPFNVVTGLIRKLLDNINAHNADPAQHVALPGEFNITKLKLLKTPDGINQFAIDGEDTRYSGNIIYFVNRITGSENMATDLQAVLDCQLPSSISIGSTCVGPKVK